ncbi:Hpt domain-containing protein [Aliidiomarina maris]|uniref:Hpt domain-containing protein n=1 Tax=Aliidiomarina maris TaxID=531312 RepID=A0A327X260_9GAMM|nr:Hpt domain-containing protein [Aliidiomarina maris]MCL5049370.1 Hpt domain-containing protein [Bacillota bacterium]RAK00631.1 Hpt domain-containing protein [Aliidiomarina maris]RUO27358.1 hypothetical protein CWE07_05295 [Aliidiomarina maris]
MSLISYSESINFDLLSQYRDLLGSEGLNDSLATLESLMPDYFEELTALRAAEDEASFRRQAHKIKGACRSLGFARMGEVMAFLERDTWTWPQAQVQMDAWQVWMQEDVPKVKAWLAA